MHELVATCKQCANMRMTVWFVKITESLDPTREAFKMLFNFRRLQAVLPKLRVELLREAILKANVTTMMADHACA